MRRGKNAVHGGYALALGLSLAMGPFFTGSALAGPAEDLDALFARYYAESLEDNPLSATYSGVDDYNDRLPDVSPEAQARRVADTEALLSALDAIPLDDVDGERRVSAAILDFILTSDLALAPYDNWRRPFLADTGFHTNLVSAMTAARFRDAEDYRDYAKRLNAIPAYFDQQIANMRQGLTDGFTQPKEIMPFILQGFDAFADASPEDHPLYKPYLDMPARMAAGEAKKLQADALAAMEQHVLPAFAKVRDFMRDEYMVGAAEKVGAQYLPDGAAYYEKLVKYYTSDPQATPDAIHETGLAEVARIRAEMQAIIDDLDFEGDFKAFQEFLRTDEQFYPKTPEEFLREAAWISKDIDGRLPKFFGKLPRQPYSVEPVPAEIAPNYTTGRYVGAPLNADRGGQYWVNTYDLKTRPLYELPALSLHEAVPGHHLQSALALEIENAPEFRKEFYPHAFGEGWGLYSEKLGVEMGVYQTPYDHFGRLSYEMWRACRLVIDTGLHAKGWTRQQALDYLADNTALSLHNVQTEVDRYIAWPGQAVAYKMGELKIWELRARAETALGEDFDIRDFHDAVLTSGGLPLNLLEARIDAYIAGAKE